MPRKQSRRLADLTDSWADVDGDASTEELSPGAEQIAQDDRFANEDHISYSEIWQQDHAALGKHIDHPTAPPQARSSGRAQPNSRLRNSVYQSQTASPRKRGSTQPQKQLRDPALVMPRIKHETEDDTSAPPSLRYRSGLRASNMGDKPRSSQSQKENQSRPYTVASFLWIHTISPILMYTFSTLWMAANYAKPFIAYALAIWLIVGGLITANNLFFVSIHKAVTPFCRIPGAGFLNLPFCPPANSTDLGPPPPVEFNNLMAVQTAFEDVANDAIVSGPLEWAMLYTELAMRDIKIVVKYSTIPSRNQLDLEFTRFIDLAEKSHYDLADYNSRIGRTIDKILVANRHTVRMLDRLVTAEAEQASSLVHRLSANKYNVFAPFQVRPEESREVLLKLYLQLATDVEDQIDLLLSQGTSLQEQLKELDVSLDHIGELVHKDGITVQADKDKLLSEIFVKLGGKRSTVQRMEKELGSLNNINSYRRAALQHVNGTILKLYAIAAHLRGLKATVSTPELRGSGGDTPLEFHIEEVNMSIERLEAIRAEGRRASAQTRQRVKDANNNQESALLALGIQGPK